MDKRLESLLSKDCPFEPWMFLLAKEVVDWLLKNLEDEELDKLYIMNVTEKIDYYLYNYFYIQSGLKPLCKCSIEELEAEIRMRKELKGE